MCFLEKEEGLALSVKGIASILKHSVPKYRHSGPLCLYIAKENTELVSQGSQSAQTLEIRLHYIASFILNYITIVICNLRCIYACIYVCNALGMQ